MSRPFSRVKCLRANRGTVTPGEGEGFSTPANKAAPLINRVGIITNFLTKCARGAGNLAEAYRHESNDHEFDTARAEMFGQVFRSTSESVVTRLEGLKPSFRRDVAFTFSAYRCHNTIRLSSSDLRKHQPQINRSSRCATFLFLPLCNDLEATRLEIVLGHQF